MSNFYCFTDLIGGGAGALDSRDGADLSDGDAALVVIDGTTYTYHLDATSGASEDSPNVIAPDSNPDSKRWILQSMAGVQGGFAFVIDGGGVAITTGIKGDLEVPFDCIITAVTLLADQTGSIKIDIWKDTYGNFSPDNADTITGANEPEISSGIKDQDSTLTSWTKTLTKGDILRFNVDSITDIERVTLSLKVTKI